MAWFDTSGNPLIPRCNMTSPMLGVDYHSDDSTAIL